jgi:hypothetical protein
LADGPKLLKTRELSRSVGDGCCSPNRKDSSAAGWSTLRNPCTLRLPHPCVFCKGGNLKPSAGRMNLVDQGRWIAPFETHEEWGSISLFRFGKGKTQDASQAQHDAFPRTVSFKLSSRVEALQLDLRSLQAITIGTADTKALSCTSI